MNAALKLSVIDYFTDIHGQGLPQHWQWSLLQAGLKPRTTFRINTGYRKNVKIATTSHSIQGQYQPVITTISTTLAELITVYLD